MELQIHNQDGTQSSKITVAESVFDITPNEPVVRQAVLSEMANSRQGTHASRNRALKHGGGRKPWRQKGRGVARAGSTRSPLWVGGGAVFGPQPHGYKHGLTGKSRGLARRSALSDKARNDALVVVESLEVKEPKTKEFATILEGLKLSDKKITVLVAALDEKLFLASRNMRNVFLCQAKNASTLDMIDCEVLLCDKAGIAVLNEQLSN